MKVSVVLVGVGGFGMIHLTEALEGKTKDLIDIVGVVEPYPQFCPKIDAIKERNIPIYSKLEDFYKEHTADLAVLSTPIAFHADQTVYCMEHGSNVLCEKPLCGSTADAERMLAAQKATGKFVLIGYQWSTSKTILNIKRDILSGVYGKLKSMKTLVLWPRGAKYFNRSTGWAGKKYTADGVAVFDSIANNACAHYLHNMFFVLGDTMGTSKMPVSINAELARANNIENFDTCVINFAFEDGGEGYFIASHATEKNLDPIFCYEFENGKIISVPNAQNGELIGKLNDGREINYGKADIASNDYKLEVAVRICMGEAHDYCGIEGASVQTKVINYIQENCEIMNFKKTRIAGDNTVVDGLHELMNEIYEAPAVGRLEKFVKETV